jgi:hypothetical protein
MRDERQYVITAIRSFLDGSSGKWDWDDFTSCSLRTARLDEMRRRVAVVELPLDIEGEATLREILEAAEQLDADGLEKRKAWRIEAGILCGAVAGAILWMMAFVQGGGIFQNLQLILVPVAVGILVVVLRNRREEVGYYDPENLEQNRQGRV